MEWVSVKERMPEKKQQVLVFYNRPFYEGYCLASYEDHTFTSINIKEGITIKKTEVVTGWMIDDFGEVDDANITHWMPFPKLIKNSSFL